MGEHRYQRLKLWLELLRRQQTMDESFASKFHLYAAACRIWSHQWTHCHNRWGGLLRVTDSAIERSLSLRRLFQRGDLGAPQFRYECHGKYLVIEEHKGRF